MEGVDQVVGNSVDQFMQALLIADLAAKARLFPYVG